MDKHQWTLLANRIEGALILEPAVLLLDEPLGALDAKLRRELQVELKSIQREIGITFVYVTHDQEEALTMSDRMAVMSGGQIEQLGTPRDVYEHPATAFVADFLGVSNLMLGSSAGDGRAAARACPVAPGCAGRMLQPWPRAPRNRRGAPGPDAGTPSRACGGTMQSPRPAS